MCRPAKCSRTVNGALAAIGAAPLDPGLHQRRRFRRHRCRRLRRTRRAVRILPRRHAHRPRRAAAVSRRQLHLRRHRRPLSARDPAVDRRQRRRPLRGRESESVVGVSPEPGGLRNPRPRQGADWKEGRRRQHRESGCRARRDHRQGSGEAGRGGGLRRVRMARQRRRLRSADRRVAVGRRPDVPVARHRAAERRAERLCAVKRYGDDHRHDPAGDRRLVCAAGVGDREHHPGAWRWATGARTR